MYLQNNYHISYVTSRGVMNKVVESFRSLMVEEQEVVSKQAASQTVKSKTGSARQSAPVANVVRFVLNLIYSPFYWCSIGFIVVCFLQMKILIRL